MELDHTLEGDRMLAAMFARGGREAPRRAGAVFGAAADEIAEEVREAHKARGWVTTSDAYARRSKGGPYDAQAFVFVSGGAAWQEDHPDRPQPTAGPIFDRVQRGIDEAVASAMERLL